MSYLAAVVLVVVIGVVLARPARAQTLSGTFKPQIAQPGTCADRVQAVSLVLSPAQPIAGQPVAVTFRFKNSCASGDPLNIPWQIAKDNLVLGEATASAVAPGQVVTVSKDWVAKAGTHFFYAGADLANTLAEGSSYRPNNQPASITITINADWTAVSRKTNAALKQAVPEWTKEVMVKDVAVNAITASGGRLEAPALYSVLHNRMITEGVPTEIAGPIASGLSAQWQMWSKSAFVPALPWYPAFASFPGPSAPPTPNVPSPLASLAFNHGYITPLSLATSMNSKLGSLASLPGAGQAVDNISQFVSACVSQWLVATNVMLVQGKGPIPTFAPPYVPTGPVVLGDASHYSKGGVVSGVFCP